MDFLPMFATGLVTSVHCVAMCGTLVLTYTMRDGSQGSWGVRMGTHATYQGAKVLSYMAVGLLLGLLGSAVDIGGIRGWVTIAAGLFMILLGLNLTGVFPWLNYLIPRPPKALVRAIAKTRKKAVDESEEGGYHLVTPLIFGLLTGLMPCGPLQAAQLYAAGTGSPSRGLVAMLGFGLGTMPLMLAFGTVSSMLTGAFKRRMMYVAAAIVMVLGLVMLNRGALIVGSPVTFQTVQEAFIGVPEQELAELTRGSDGVAEVNLTIRNVRFEPSTIALPQSEPVRLIVDRQEDAACSDEIRIPQLGVFEELPPFATTVIDLPPAAGGRYTLTCGMGMMSGVVVVGAAAAVGGGPSPATILLVAAVIAGGIWYLIRRRAPAAKGPAHEDRPAGKAVPLVLGFTPVEVMVIASAVAAAVIAGLLFGGALTF